MSQIHKSAQSGYSCASPTYASGRPDYPAGIGEWLKRTGQLGAGKKALDLGAGTGKFSKALLETGAHVTAVEPVREMLDQLQKSLPEIEARQGSANQIPLDAQSVDAVFCAQSFHWFATRETLAEIRRVLKPGGLLGLIWNVRDESRDWVAELSRIMVPYEADTPRFRHGQWRLVFPAKGFSGLQEKCFEHAHTGSFETVVLDRIMSISFIAALPLCEQEKVEQQIFELAGKYPELANPISVTFPYQTLVAWATKN